MTVSVTYSGLHCVSFLYVCLIVFVATWAQSLETENVAVSQGNSSKTGLFPRPKPGEPLPFIGHFTIPVKRQTTVAENLSASSFLNQCPWSLN